MSYFEKVLQPGEKVLYNRKLHWIVYLNRLLVLLVITAVFTPVLITPPVNPVFPAILGVVWFFTLIGVWIKRFSTEIVVTDKRIILKQGLLFHKTVEMNMDKVETVDVLQSILGRALNYGTVIIRGAGSTYEPLAKVASPLELRNAIVVR